MASEAANKGQDFFRAQSNNKSLGVSSPSRSKSLLIAQSSLRVAAFVSTLIALCIMVTSNEVIVLFGIQFRAHYSYSSAFRFLFGTDVVVCCFSALSLILLRLVSLSGSNPRNYFFLFLHDLVMTVLMISGCAAGTAIGYVGQYGEGKMGWIRICDRVSKFCNRALVSVVFSYLAFFCCLALTITSANKLMTRFVE